MPRLPSQVAAPAPPPSAGDTALLDGVLDHDLSAGAGLAFHEDTVSDPARLIEGARPRYPALAVQRRLTGKVSVRIAVGADGAVTDVQVLSAEPAGVFERSAIEAVRQYRFAPARVAGRPVPVLVRQELRFELR